VNNISAFPHENFLSHRGMTLRDYFAAKAMQGFMGSSWNVKSFEDMASKAYQLADAMLKAKGE